MRVSFAEPNHLTQGHHTATIISRQCKSNKNCHKLTFLLVFTRWREHRLWLLYYDITWHITAGLRAIPTRYKVDGSEGGKIWSNYTMSPPPQQSGAQDVCTNVDLEKEWEDACTPIMLHLRLVTTTTIFMRKTLI